MENGLILNSIGIGGAIFAGLILLWFISIYIQKRMASDRSSQGFITTKKTWEEKRLNARVAISWQAILESFGRADDVQIKDISLGGAFVACPNCWELGSLEMASFNNSIDLESLLMYRISNLCVWNQRRSGQILACLRTGSQIEVWVFTLLKTARKTGNN